MKIDFKPVDDYNMPDYTVELLALSPEGNLHLTNWRPAYKIFTCQAKSEDSDGWHYCEIEVNKVEPLY